MLLYLSLGGMHRLVADYAVASPTGTAAPEQWSFPFGRTGGVAALLDNVTSGGAFATPEERRRIVVGSTPAPDLAILMMDPPKFDWRSFADFGVLGFWAEGDRRAAAQRGLTYAKYHEASRAFRGLQCDGMHFGNSWQAVAGCDGFTAVTDLVTHQYLSAVCDGVDPEITARSGPGAA